MPICDHCHKMFPKDGGCKLCKDCWTEIRCPKTRIKIWKENRK